MTGNEKFGTGPKPVRFKDLKVGDTFLFPSQSSSQRPTSFGFECIKTGTRTYETVHAIPHYQRPGLPPDIKPMRCKVGSINVEIVRSTK